MKCPTDGTTLAISERRGIEIDYCPQCRGVWLDRGELDKLLDRAAEEVPEPRYEREPERRPDRDHDRDRDRDRDGDRDRRDSPPRPDYRKKKKSFLSEFLEFGD